MDVNNPFDASVYSQVAYKPGVGRASAVSTPVSSASKTPLDYTPFTEGERNTKSSSSQYSSEQVQKYQHPVEQVRELKPVNVHPKNHAAIDTFLNIAHYSGGDTIINTYV